MKFTMVQPPIVESIKQSVLPPLGLLTIATVLQNVGARCEVLDFNLAGVSDPGFLEPDVFYDTAVAWIESTEPDVVAFTSMALDSHVALKLAQLLKQNNPTVRIVLGGAHFSSIATVVINRYPWIDYVIVGDGEQPSVELYEYLIGERELRDVCNVAHRTQDSVALRRSTDARWSMGAVPFPDYSLVSLADYFEINSLDLVAYEHARGCQLKCSFCYSATHWGHGERRKSVSNIVQDLAKIDALGARNVFLVADNFLNNSQFALELCSAITEADLSLKWHCYATLAQLQPDTVKAMARAGCTAVFVGVDAASEFNKRSFKKFYFRGWRKLKETVELCLRYGIKPTCSFMISTSDSAEGIAMTIAVAASTQAIGGQVCINALGVYNSTPLDDWSVRLQPEYNEGKPRLLFDTPAINIVNEYALSHPEDFPMHQSAPKSEVFGDLFEFCLIAEELIYRLPLTTAALSYRSDQNFVKKIEFIRTSVFDKTRRFVEHSRTAIGKSCVIGLAATLDEKDDLRDIMLYEILDQRDGDDTLRPVTVEVGQRLVHCFVNEAEQLELPGHPNQLDLEKVLNPGEMDGYLVTSFRRVMHVTHLRELGGDLLGALAKIQNGTENLRISAANFNQLTRAFVLIPKEFIEQLSSQVIDTVPATGMFSIRGVIT